ncbi:molybdopterin cofactor-binding domain-containing protein [Caballeronia mineralivorans]|jgi:xanthine dehydrogenase/oxidase|uniref:molybdopterin cofactor-binding domain-containing protein n=1 Tax=Caballeronia mineralivorans TaxID=2010198 RepID=UPI0023F3B824|nr:molybdopterin cofactor-binding domain-containing protein [Caballeronia mineralivorans]MDB5785455.1 xdhA 2 [Caballeronia mineralivorans]MEA3101917.1 xanthine dehydrogenase large subunit [Caballeronia mineralivorans]
MSGGTGYVNRVDFFLNGEPVSIENPSPDFLLIDFLRSSDIGLAGPKKACGQGGCGSCTVILSSWKDSREEHRAINACLRPVCLLGGLVVTTVEGTGAPGVLSARYPMHAPTSGFAPLDWTPPPAVQQAATRSRMTRIASRTTKLADFSSTADMLDDSDADLQGASNPPGINPVAQRLAANNGSQCGYCTVGFVMNMSEFIVNNPHPTKQQIEDIFDGNICRCTGYRPILTGMKTFASDYSPEDEKDRMKCLLERGQAEQLPAASVTIPFPEAARSVPRPVTIGGPHCAGKQWYTATSWSEARDYAFQCQAQAIPYQFVHGNTSFGIYKDEYLASRAYIDVRRVPELNRPHSVDAEWLTVGAGITYSDLIGLLDSVMAQYGQSAVSPAAALRYMARRTAGRIVRNAATLGGNTMLVMKHVFERNQTSPGYGGEPFPSDTLTALAAIGAEITFVILRPSPIEPPLGATTYVMSAQQAIAFFQGLGGKTGEAALIVSYRIPLEKANQIVLSQKVALREVNSHAIINMTSNTVWAAAGGEPSDSYIHSASLVFGGIADAPWPAGRTETFLNGLGRPLTAEDLAESLTILEREVRQELGKWTSYRAMLPDEGFSDDYRVALALSLFYKVLINALVHRGVPVAPAVASAGEIPWGNWGVSSGRQSYAAPPVDRHPVGLPYIKNTAIYQAVGKIHYTHELAVPPRTMHGAFVQSLRALAEFYLCLPDSPGTEITRERLKAHLAAMFPDQFADVLTCDSVPPHGLNFQGKALDQPLFAKRSVHYPGQTIAMVMARDEQAANDIAEYATRYCIGYRTIAWDGSWPANWNEPVLSIEDAIARNSIFPDAPRTANYVAHIWKITRPEGRFDWIDSDRELLDRCIEVSDLSGVPDQAFANCIRLANSQRNGGQVHFYMETQACLVIPQDEGRFIVHPSSQSPMEMHQTAAMAIGVPYNRLDVRVAPLGGGFGGKTEQARFVTGPAVVAAYRLNRPVRVVLPRDVDTRMIGKRHGFFGQCQIAVDRTTHQIKGFWTQMWGDGGAYYDCSFIVSNCIQLRADNVYNVPNYQSQIDVCRTNTAPSTAMRAFGDLQGKNIIENAIDDAAVALGIPSEQLREANFYSPGDTTPFGQVLDDCYIKQVWNWLKSTCAFEDKYRAVEQFNRNNTWRKRGIAMIPVKYGSGYNLLQMEQAAGIAVVNQADGTVTIHQSGVEMGQGLITQVLQVAAYVLNIPMEMIHIESPKTSITPNPTSSGASTGTQYNCEVAKAICEDLASRLRDFGQQLRANKGEQWCKDNGVNYWDYKESGWAQEVFAHGQTALIWQNLIHYAYVARLNLIASFTVQVAGGEESVPWKTYKPLDQQPRIPGIEVDESRQPGGTVDCFVGFTYSAACSVVEVDILTGEVKIISSDIAYDMGWSMNPAIDIGQVEGAFVQGIGYLISEDLVFEPGGDEKGRLNTVNTLRYKVPAHASIPLEMNVHLFPRNDPSVAGMPTTGEHGIYSSKEVGEPPMVLANSVFFAIKAAIRASRVERNLTPLFFLDAPATVQEVRRACEVGSDALVLLA